MVELWRDFWIRETGTGQQVAQLHERYDDDDDDIILNSVIMFSSLSCPCFVDTYTANISRVSIHPC